MSIHIAKLLQRTYISMLNGTFQNITTHTYFIIETYSFTVPKTTVDVRNLAKSILVYTTDRSNAVVQILFLLCVAL